MKMRSIVVIILSIIVLCLTGCSRSSSDKTADDRCYRSTSFILEDCDTVRRTEYYDGKYYLFTDFFDYDEISRDITDMITCYSVDANSQPETIITFENEDIVDLCLMNDGDIAVLKSSEIWRVDPQSGASFMFTNEVPVEVQFADGNIMYPCGDGLAIILSNKAILYNDTGEVISSVESDLLNGSMIANGFCGDEDTSLVAQDNFGMVEYLSVSWENGSVKKLTDSETIGLDYVSAIQGVPYSIDCQTCDVYRIDPESCETELYAAGANMLIPPTDDGFSGYGDMMIADEDHLISVRSIDSGCRIILIEEDPDLDLANREIVRIGCTDVINSPSIKQAAYLFNSSQDEYLAVIEEYDIDYSNITQSILDLTGRFNEGDVPDIFCGNYFDYDTWGRSGMVINLTPYLDNKQELLDSVVCSWTDNDDTCYSVFPSFSLMGFFATSEIIQSNDLPISGIPKPADGQSVLGGGVSVENLAYYTIIGEICNNRMRDGNSELSADDISSILEYAINYGISPDGTVNSVSFGNIVDNTILLVGGQPRDIDEFVYADESISGHVIYVGYPSVDGSNHIMVPNSQVAVSSDTEHLQPCIDLVMMLFDDEVQEQCLLNPNCGIPVVEHVMDDYLSRRITDDGLDPASVQAYIDYVDSGDQVIIQDNALYDIVVQEIDSYYYNSIPIEQVADSLTSRINIYLAENCI